MSNQAIQALLTNSNVGQQSAMKSMIASISSDVYKTAYATLNNQGFSHYQRIRGDGNCYFRAIMRSYMDQAVCHANPDSRQRLFSHLANLIRTNLLNNPNSYFLDDFVPNTSPEWFAMQRLVNALDAAAAGSQWMYLQNFWQDLIDDTPTGTDLSLIRAGRYLVAECIKENQNTEFNGMSLNEAILIEERYSSCANLAEYIQHYVTGMGECAEGAWVDLHLLAHMLGAAERLFIIPRDSAIQELTTNPSLCLPALRTHYIRTEVPLSVISLAFHPGHYDALLTHDNYLQQQANHRAAPSLPISTPSLRLEPAPPLPSPVIPTIPSTTKVTELGRIAMPTFEKLADLLNELHNKAIKLQAKASETHRLGAEAAFKLHNELSSLQKAYFNPIENRLNLTRFERLARAAISQAEPELNKHRDFKQLLLDILNVILFPIGMITWMCTGQFRLFVAQTDSGKLVSEIKHTLDELPLNTPN